MTSPASFVPGSATRPATPSLARLWIGVAAAPTAWSVAELAGYIGGGRGCWRLWAGIRSIGPTNSSVWVLIVAGITAAAAVGGLLVAAANLRAVPAGSPGASRARFMAVFGTGASALFLFGIVLFAVPPLFNHACIATR
ncbi:MAG: hypothetical protein ACREL5_12390 [Gemmatimonadales bacterium]